MKNNLIIVESPAKAKTLKKYLGENYEVQASRGHVRDLPPRKFGVDLKKDFQPTYEISEGKEAVIQELKKFAQKSKKIYLAPDPDREGEAIAWHLSQLLDIEKKAKRIELHEITQEALEEALANPHNINLQKVNAQQARRILDRIVGYKISPLLGRKVRWGLSAGRVQSVALNLICSREKEIEKFVPQEYWTIEANLVKKGDKKFFSALLHKKNKKKIEIDNEEQANKIVADLEKAPFVVQEVTVKNTKRMPPLPFTTSTLQQEAWRKLNFNVKNTMILAQQLYEGVQIGKNTTGLITYMRTDSTRISQASVNEGLAYIKETFGPEFCGTSSNVRKTKKDSKKKIQDAHEAIRPTSVLREPEKIKQYLSPDLFKLYKLIWERFVASLMSPAVFENTRVDIKANNYLFIATGTKLIFAGFHALLPAEKVQELPPLTKDEELKLKKITPKQHFTEPPPRYNEGSLVKIMEENGVGRPSTYAPIIENIKQRGYVTIKKKAFYPTDVGKIVDNLMTKHFPQIVDVKFTAHMENNLDQIEMGKAEWIAVLSDFYKDFSQTLKKADAEMERVKVPDEPTGQTCNLCGQPMVIKTGRFGKFTACSNYPTCKNKIKEPDEPTGQSCDLCGQPMVIKIGRFSKFIACSNYPTCKNTVSLANKIGVKCPLCNGDIVEKRTKKGRIFYSCNKFPACKFSSWKKLTNEKCPQCNNIMVIKSENEKATTYLCSNEKCAYLLKK